MLCAATRPPFPLIEDEESSQWIAPTAAGLADRDQLSGFGFLRGFLLYADREAEDAFIGETLEFHDAAFRELYRMTVLSSVHRHLRERHVFNGADAVTLLDIRRN